MRLLATHRIDLRTPATTRLALVAAAVSTSAAVPRAPEAGACRRADRERRDRDGDHGLRAGGRWICSPPASSTAAGCATSCCSAHWRRSPSRISAFSAVPALAGSDRAAPGTSAQLVMEALVAIAFTAAAFAPSKTIADGVRAAGRRGGHRRHRRSRWSLDCSKSSSGPGWWAVRCARSQLATASHDPVAIAIAVCSSVVLSSPGLAFVSRAGRGDEKRRSSRGSILPARRREAPDRRDAGRRRGLGHSRRRIAARRVRAVADGGAARASCRRGRTRRAQAVTAERQRIARDLHDGLAQDLALISLHAQYLQSEAGTEHPLAIAARHALAVSRGAIGDLSALGRQRWARRFGRWRRNSRSAFGVHVNVEIERDAGGTPMRRLRRRAARTRRTHRPRGDRQRRAARWRATDRRHA